MADRAWRDIMAVVAERTLELSESFVDGEALGRRWSTWDWSIGVAFYGVLRAEETLAAGGRYSARMKRWIDKRIGTLPAVCVNTNALLLTVLHLHAMRPEPAYADLFAAFDDYLANRAPRVPSGALAHTVVGHDYAGQVWADTLFMSALYMMRRGVLLGRGEMIREAMFQLERHLTLLRDERTQLFWHGWDDVRRKPLGERWGRGNAWIAASVVEMLELYAPHGDAGTTQRIAAVLGQQLAALEALQEPDGCWRTVLDDASTYAETSVTAGVAFAARKAVRLGLADRRFGAMAERAMRAVVGRIDPQGDVLGGSSGTPVCSGASAYNAIPTEVTPFAQGLALLALCEAARAASEA